MSGLPLSVLLQSGGFRFFQQADRRTLWIFVGVVGVFLVLLVAASLATRRNRPLDPEQRRKYNRFVFARMAREMGLQKAHVDTLEYLVKACKVMQPFLVFSNPGLLDDVLRKGIYSLERAQGLSEEERESRLTVIFQIKQAVERSARLGVGIRSTSLLRPGQPLVVVTEAGGRYASQVVSNMKDTLALSTPRDTSGQEMRWQKGTPLKVSFWRDGDAGYVFETRTRGYETVKGASSLLILHSKTLRREQRRKHRRRPLDRPCFLYPIQVVEAGEGAGRKPKAVVQASQRRLGTMQDISGGGCSVSSLSPLGPGSLLRLDFEIGKGSTLTVYGKVRRVRQEQRRGGVMHVMFTRVSGQHLNRIYSYVYNYTSQSAAPARSG